MFKINNLEYIYKNEKSTALENINMDFDKGDVIGVIGSNGSGKSTLFMNLMGILKPVKGEILFNNKKIEYNKKGLYNLRKNVGMVFQDPDKQIFYSNVYDDIAFALRNLGIEESEVKERVVKALEDVNGLEFINKPAHYLSYGQKKRVAIASIIAMNQKIVLLDEPCAGLDPISTNAILDIIVRLKNKGIKVVISSHDMNLIYDICDYIYVLNKGKIIEEGKNTEVFLDEDKITKAGLELPWIVEIHKNTGIPLYTIKKEIYEYIKNIGKVYQE